MYKRIEILRKLHSLTEQNISEYLNISTSLYSLYESGKREIPWYILSKLAKKYQTSIDYLIGDTDDSNPHLKN